MGLNPPVPVTRQVCLPLTCSGAWFVFHDRN